MIMSSSAPTIANWTQTGSAGDALVLSGQNLIPNSSATVTGKAPNGATFSLPATVKSADGTGAVIVLPQSLPSNTVFSLSVANAQGTSNSATVNAPQVWWVGPNEAVQGGVTSIFGQNLILSSSDKPTVTLKLTSGPNAGQTYALSVADANAYRVDVKIPSNLPVGDYTVLYNSGAGAGGALDASQTQAPVLQVGAATTPSNIATINLANYGGVAGQDNTAAFSAAMNAAQAMVGHNGITQVKIQVGAGVYYISSSIDLGNNIDLEGMGAGQTTIKATSNFTVTGAGAGMLWTNQSMYGTGTVADITIGNMAIDTSGHSNSNVSWSYAPNSSNPFNAISARNINGLTINSVNIQAQNGQPLDAAGDIDVTLENSKIVGPGINLGSANQVFFHGNSFYGTNQSEGSILSQGASDVAVYNNTAQDLDPNPTLSDVLTNTSQGRFYVNQPQSGGSGRAVNQYIAGNQTNGIGPRANLSSSGADMNVGEQILFEGAGTTRQFSLSSGLFSSSTPTSLKLNTASPNISKAGLVGTLTVISGTGATETTQITGYNSSTGTYTFQTPLAVPLDATSMIQITQGPSQVAIVGNTLQGLTQDVAAGGKTGQSGVEVYPGGANVDIVGNSFVNLPKGVNLWNFNTANGAGNFVGSSFFQIDNNTFTNVNNGVTFVDGYPTNWHFGSLSVADNRQVIGTTIEHNNLSGVNQAALAVITNGGSNAVDVAAENVASGNVLPSKGALFEIQGIDGGSQNLLILNNQSTSLPSGSLMANAITYSTDAFPGSANPIISPEFVGYYLADGSFAEDQIASVAGTYGGKPALIATAPTGNWLGIAATIYPWQGSQVQVLNGGTGDDILVGSAAGAQALNGGTGSDIIVAATGASGANFAKATLTGGTGATQFVFSAGAQYAANTVTNFNAAKGDEVVLPNLVPTGVNPFTAGYLKIQTSGGNSTLLYDAAGGGTSFMTLGTFNGVSLSPSNIITGQATQTPDHAVQASVPSDFNGDGHSDILWQNVNGQVSIWGMNGMALVSNALVNPSNPGTSWQAIGAGDFNHDGHSDILFQNSSTGQVSIWEMNGNSEIGGGVVPTNLGPDWKAIGTGDFNGDGLSDILFQNSSTGQVSIWEMNGNTQIGGGTVAANPGPAWKAIGAGDFNDDDHSDILFQNTSTGQVSIWEMNGNTQIGGGTVAANPGVAWKAIGAGDFNHDDHSDILFQNTGIGQVSIWEMNGNTQIGGGTVAANPGSGWHAIGTGDFNGDGFSDILWQNANNGGAAIWEMNGTNQTTGHGAVGSPPGVSWHEIKT
jgi:FG-GAP-like repeat